MNSENASGYLMKIKASPHSGEFPGYMSPSSSFPELTTFLEKPVSSYTLNVSFTIFATFASSFQCPFSWHAPIFICWYSSSTTLISLCLPPCPPSPFLSHVGTSSTHNVFMSTFVQIKPGSTTLKFPPQLLTFLSTQVLIISPGSLSSKWHKFLHSSQALWPPKGHYVTVL